MEYSWFRMHHEIIDDEKVGQLAFEDRWFFVAILCLKCRGMLDKYVGAKLDNHVGFKLGLGDVDRDRLRIRLAEAGLITSEWQPVGWDGRQYVKSDHNGAQRVRDSRAKRNGNVTVTQPSVSVSASVLKKEEQESEEEKTLLQKIREIYPKNPHGYFISSVSLRMLEDVPEQEILDGIKRYAKKVRHEGNENTKFVLSVRKFFEQYGWREAWELPEQPKEHTESDDEKARRAKAREMLEKMERGELRDF